MLTDEQLKQICAIIDEGDARDRVARYLLSQGVTSAEFHHMMYGERTKAGFHGWSEWLSSGVYNRMTDVERNQVCKERNDADDIRRFMRYRSKQQPKRKSMVNRVMGT